MIITSDEHVKKYGNRPVCTYCFDYSIMVLSSPMRENQLAFCARHTIELVKEISTTAERKVNHADNVEN